MIVLAGCSSGAGQYSPDDAIMSGTELVQEYRSTVQHFDLPLPPGATMPADPPASLGKASGQVGAAKAPAYFYWLCSWEREYLLAFAEGDEPRADHALDEVASFESTDFARRYVEDPGHQWRRHVVEPARLGDPSGVRDDMRSGCEPLGVEIP